MKKQFDKSEIRCDKNDGPCCNCPNNAYDVVLDKDSNSATLYSKCNYPFVLEKVIQEGLNAYDKAFNGDDKDLLQIIKSTYQPTLSSIKIV